MSDVYKIIALLKEVMSKDGRRSIRDNHDIESWNNGYSVGYQDALRYLYDYITDELEYDTED